MSCEVSVVIATRDRPSSLKRLLEGLQRQTGPAGMEVVVVDDGSASALTVDRASQVRVVRTEGIERSAARNLGARAATGDLLLFLDDDLIVPADLVRAHLQAHQEWREALAVGAIDLPASGRPFVAFRQRLERAGIPQARGPVPSRTFCTAANMSIPRERFVAIGGFDEGMASAEDQDLALRFTGNGGGIVFIPEARVVHDDTALDIRSYCVRVEKGAAALRPFVAKWPELEDNRARARVNGPIRPAGGPTTLTLLKVVKAAWSAAPMREALFGLCAVLERIGAEALLDPLYRLLVGIHLWRGFAWMRRVRHG